MVKEKNLLLMEIFKITIVKRTIVYLNVKMMSKDGFQIHNWKLGMADYTAINLRSKEF